MDGARQLRRLPESVVWRLGFLSGKALVGIRAGRNFMDAEMAALSSSVAATLVTLMTTDGWEGAKSALAGLWRRHRPEQARAVEVELDAAHANVQVAVAAGDEQALAELVAEWRGRLSALLAQDTALAAELGRLVEDLRVTAGADGRVVMKATARGHGKVYQAGRDLTVNGG